MMIVTVKSHCWSETVHKDDIIERLAIAIYFAYADLSGAKGARWEAVAEHHKETVWRFRAREALGL